MASFPSLPPTVASERHRAKVSRRRPGAVMCNWTDAGTPATECHAAVGSLDRIGTLRAGTLEVEAWGPSRLTLDPMYERGEDGYWRESRRSRVRRPDPKGLGRKPNVLHGDNLTGRSSPKLPAWLRCRSCNNWRFLDPSRLGVDHPDNIVG